MSSLDKGVLSESDLSFKNCVVGALLDMITIVFEYFSFNLIEKVKSEFSS